ncbi:hypothetical protein TSUD_290170 [Trifolium subterraneum]|uniref:Importin N-terminal domain-containing protein n=1 Tax=Trifolium subterraneum TaxID=3900 RepID=A0A2Z6N6X1_TRISU|nr:hypothetical protein TSUD_290170 [Trifolium subterraneum]
MESNPQTLQSLRECFLDTLSPSLEPRRVAKFRLSEAVCLPNFGLVILRLVAEPDKHIEQSLDEQIRLAASVNFKNHLRLRWSSEDNPITESEKEQIKTLIVPLMFSANVTAKIQSKLRETLAIIVDGELSKSWPSLLPELVSNLRKSSQDLDYVSINGILGCVNSIFSKFCCEYKTNDLLFELKHCLVTFAAPLLEIFLRTAALIDAPGAAATAAQLFESHKLCCMIFYSLNYLDLPEFFEDHMNEWMTEAAVCENINLYMDKYEEEFKDYVTGFAHVVWTLLQNVLQSTSRDQLAITGIKFLTTTGPHHTLFAADGIIPHICQGIVIPVVMLREDDEEQFVMNHIEYIMRDMEGSYLDTRRRISLLSSFAANPAVNWKHKDCAIYLVVSLSTKKAGTDHVSTDLVDVQSFFQSVIVPELQSSDVNGYPMLKAGALKFFTIF